MNNYIKLLEPLLAINVILGFPTFFSFAITCIIICITLYHITINIIYAYKKIKYAYNLITSFWKEIKIYVDYVSDGTVIRIREHLLERMIKTYINEAINNNEILMNTLKLHTEETVKKILENNSQKELFAPVGENNSQKELFALVGENKETK